jgi:hypothetical protein
VRDTCTWVAVCDCFKLCEQCTWNVCYHACILCHLDCRSDNHASCPYINDKLYCEECRVSSREHRLFKQRSNNCPTIYSHTGHDVCACVDNHAHLIKNGQRFDAFGGHGWSELLVVVSRTHTVHSPRVTLVRLCVCVCMSRLCGCMVGECACVRLYMDHVSPGRPVRMHLWQCIGCVRGAHAKVAEEQHEPATRLTRTRRSYTRRDRHAAVHISAGWRRVCVRTHTYTYS